MDATFLTGVVVCQFGSFSVDFVESERHKFSFSKSEFPLEDGSKASDHVRRLPTKVTIKGKVSDTAVSLLIPQAGTATARTGRAKSILDNLLGLADKKEPFTLVTGLYAYVDMVFVHFEVINESNYREFDFVAVLEHLETIPNSQITSVPSLDVISLRAMALKNYGTVSTKLVNFGVAG